MIVRAPNHLGDVVVALPVLAHSGCDVLVTGWLAPLVAMAALPGTIIPLDRSGMSGWLSAVGTLRRGGYQKGALLSPAFSAAWLFRCGGVHTLRGSATDGRSWLLTEALDPAALRGRPRGDQYRALVGIDDGTSLPRPALTPPPDRVARWRGRTRGVGPIVGVVPGSNAPARRWSATRFSQLVGRLSAAGARCVVAGGPTETRLSAQVAGGAEDAIDAGGETDLEGLAALLAVCDLVVGNDTGPLHMAGAMGTPTVTIWGPSDPAEALPTGSKSVAVESVPLPCRPCFKNECPREGVGTHLPLAHEECMQLITVDQVTDASLALLEGLLP